MKTKLLLFAISAVTLSFTACSDDDDTPATSVPEICTQAFKAKYPTVTSAKWGKEGAYYTAEWKEASNLRDVEAWFSPAATSAATSWAMTTTDYGKDLFMVPTELNNAFNATEYSTATIDDIEKIEYQDTSRDIYTIEVTPQGQRADLLLIFKAADYTFVKAIPEPEGDITPDTVL